MIVKLGGSFGVTLTTSTQYENIKVSTIFEIHKEFPDDVPFETIEEQMKKVDVILSKDLNKKIERAIKEYKENKDRYKKLL